MRDGRHDFFSLQPDGVHDRAVRDGAQADLGQVTVVPEHLAQVKDLLRDLRWAADQQVTVELTGAIEGRPAHMPFDRDRRDV